MCVSCYYHSIPQFQINTVIEQLDLTGNCIGARGAIYIARVLRENLFITDVVRIIMCSLYSLCSVLSGLVDLLGGFLGKGLD